MALAQLKPVYDEVQGGDVPRFSAEADQASPSPAMLLQQRLHAETAARPSAGKWPIGQSVALIVAASLALWTAILTALNQIAHVLA